MPKIFISYYQTDTQQITQMLYLLMCQYFGISNISLSTDDKPGDIRNSDIVLVMIGRQWDVLMRKNIIQKKKDAVRIEIETALRQNKVILPVLVKNANISDYESLPDSIAGLRWIDMLNVRDVPDMENDCEHLLMTIEDALKMRVPRDSDDNKFSTVEEEIPSFKDLISKPLKKLSTPERSKALIAKNPKFNSFEWIDIPSGRIPVKGNRYSYLPVTYQQDMFIQAFSITKYPVTNLQYALYVSATGRVPEYWTNPKFNKPHQPVVGVSAFDVMDYCDWLSDQLGYDVTIPGEHQWQRAAQGNDGRDYPWGNRWQATFANTDEKINHTTPVQEYPQGASPFGVMDMAGNVWEWCFVEPEMEAFVNASVILCGGSWLNYSMFATVNARNIRLPNMDYTDVGFRLARF